MGDTCYRNKDGGTQATSAVEGEDATTDDDEDAGAGSGTDTSLDAGRSADVSDGGDVLDVDTGAPAVDAATWADADATATDVTLVDAAWKEGDSAVVDAALASCTSKPCQNGGSCTDGPSGYRCSCPEPFIGNQCQARTCPTLFLRTHEDLAKARTCGEIQGDLNIASAGITSIAAADLQHLTKISGNLNVSAMYNSTETPRLQSLTLAALREVNGELAIVFTGSGSLEEIHFPALTRVGTSGQERAISFGLTDTKVLDLSALTTVNGYFHVSRLYFLCSLYVGKLETVTGDLQLNGLHNLTPSAIGPLVKTAEAAQVVSEIGCCASERLACEAYAGQTRCGC